jgi:chromosome segregation ATPase
MDTLDLDNTSLIDSSPQPTFFGTKVLEDLSKIDPNESREVIIKLSKAEVKISKLSAALKSRDSEINRLEKLNSDMQNLLKNSDIEKVNLELQHLQFLNKALEQKFQESQIKIYNLEKSEKREMKELKFKVEELEKDKIYLEESLVNYKDQAMMAEFEKNYLVSRNEMLEKRIKQLENEKNSGIIEISPRKIVREKTVSDAPQKSSLSSALKLFQEFPLGRNNSNPNY